MMGTSFQGKLKVVDGKIMYVSKGKDFVQIDTNLQSYFFENAFALPGFSDSHGHIAALGSKLNGLDFLDCLSSEECIEKALKNPKQKGDWIVGFGWNHELWNIKEFPNNKILDKYFIKTPVCLTRIDGHAVWINSSALKAAKIDKFTPNPEGGIIEKDKSGNPTGILHDNAIDLVKDLIPKYTDSQLKENIQTALKELVRNGITSVHDMDVRPELLSIYRTFASKKELPLRIYTFVSGYKYEWLKHNIEPEYNDFFNIIGVKFYADGSLGSRTAAMLEDYSDKKGHRGIFLISDSELYSKANIALTMNFNVAVHAIGDAANRMVLQTFRKLLADASKNIVFKLRVEHAQHIHPDDQKIFNDGNIIASVQPVHCISDSATIAGKRLGERCNYAYPWKSLIENGAHLISGSDFPIESNNPLIGIDALTKRIPYGQTKAWYKEEILDIETAVNSYTCYPHLATSSNLQLGDIREGFLADIVILDKDIFTYPDTNKINVLGTFVNGEKVF
ncbi:MAG: amidohydrolase [bacterium]